MIKPGALMLPLILLLTGAGFTLVFFVYRQMARSPVPMKSLQELSVLADSVQQQLSDLHKEVADLKQQIADLRQGQEK